MLKPFFHFDLLGTSKLSPLDLDATLPLLLLGSEPVLSSLDLEEALHSIKLGLIPKKTLT